MKSINAKTVRELQRGLALRCESVLCQDRGRMSEQEQYVVYEKCYFGDSASDEHSAIDMFLSAEKEFVGLLDFDEESGKYRLNPSITGYPDRIFIVGEHITAKLLSTINPGKPYHKKKNRIGGRNLLTKGRHEALRNCKKAVSCGLKLDDIVEKWAKNGSIEKYHSGKNATNFLAAVDSLMYGLLVTAKDEKATSDKAANETSSPQKKAAKKKVATSDSDASDSDDSSLGDTRSVTDVAEGRRKKAADDASDSKLLAALVLLHPPRRPGVKIELKRKCRPCLPLKKSVLLTTLNINLMMTFRRDRKSVV